ncbi:hypothetical protein RHSIM_Rhsim05G0208500 [Rhododendron simsii]|uniref:Uncharacterized protein n=1 Tax=Rhododendron simsii TaxID=118357 RepID=A0A834GXI7_RHOSS|nr:hypothetical protein RHSIM_Rhsim05G0208500 [Rhododendron simsii]
MYRLDDTLMEHSPCDAVLSLFKRINLDMFIHSIVNAAYNSPFFISRFYEALFHCSALFDMFEANAPRENEERMLFEREILGNEETSSLTIEYFMLRNFKDGNKIVYLVIMMTDIQIS